MRERPTCGSSADHPRKCLLANTTPVTPLIRITTALLAAWLAAACSNIGNIDPEGSPDTSTTVTRDGSTIVYSGALSDQANHQVQALIDTDTRTLRIASRGGEIHLGMDLGQLVFLHGLDVEVGEHCLSSCANYVFPAGRRKILHRHSQLGWHGGAFQPMRIDDARMRQAYEDYIGPAQARETAYFRQIGVSQRSTTLGQGEAYARYADCVGWRYTIDAMAQLGMRHVVLADGQWRPDDRFDGKCIFTINDVTGG